MPKCLHAAQRRTMSLLRQREQQQQREECVRLAQEWERIRDELRTPGLSLGARINLLREAFDPAARRAQKDAP